MGNDVNRREIQIVDDPRSLAAAAAAAMTDELGRAVEQHGRALLVLAGGSTPRSLYECLATDHARLPWWDTVEFLFGDERSVPPHDAASNYRMANEALLEPLGIAPARVHRIRGEFAPAIAADAYESELRDLLAGDSPRLDLALLGLGEDGHTASLFPGSPSLDEEERWVVATRGPVAPHDRVTLTLPILNRAERVLFLVTGRAKSAAVAAILGPNSNAELPAACVGPLFGRTTWWLDREAATRL